MGIVALTRSRPAHYLHAHIVTQIRLRLVGVGVGVVCGYASGQTIREEHNLSVVSIIIKALGEPTKEKMEVTIGEHARQTYDQVRSHGPASLSMEFPEADIRLGIVVDALVVFPVRQKQEVCEGIVRRANLVMNGDTTTTNDEIRAYWPIRKLQRSLYGDVYSCLLLQPHRGQEAQRTAAETQGIDSIVWESTEEFVAIKRQRRDKFGQHADDPEMEIAVMQFLGAHHPNVLGLVEALQDDEYLYLVTQYCQNGDLFDIVKDGGRMSEPEARYWFRQILSGLHHLQSRGICHRDLSPENILVRGGTLKIFDFGMALWEPYSDPTKPDCVTNVLEGKDRLLIKRLGRAGKYRYMVRVWILIYRRPCECIHVLTLQCL